MADLPVIIPGITLGSILLFFLTLGVVTLISYFCYRAAKAFLLRYASRTNSRWAARLTGYFIFIALIYVADLRLLGLDLNATIASLGIISIAIAFASQQIISNLLAGILIAINRTVRLDDWVELGGDPQTGIAQVKDLTFTRTVLEGRDGRVFQVPNATLLSSKVINYSRSGCIEVPVDITLPFSVSPDHARDVILSALAQNPDVLPNGLQSGQHRSGMGESYFFSGYRGRKTDSASLQPRVIITGISHIATAVSIRFWIADATRREEIVHAVLTEVTRQLRLT
jgi:small-conductance mechanosensitive channel